MQLNEAPPTWWDSRDPTASANGPGNSGVPLPVPAAVSADAKSITLSASAIKAAQSLTYPVYLDPSWTGADAGWTFVDSAYPSVDYYNGENASDGYVHVGYVTAADSNDGNSHTARSFFKMDTHGVAGKHIVSAQFNIHLYYSSSCTKEAVDLYRSTDAISSSTTWNNQPALSTKQDEQSVAYRSGCATGGTSDGYLPVGFDATDAATYAAAHSSSTTTLALKALHESDHSAYTWKKFGDQPRLSITYDSIPGTAGGRSVSSCYRACSGVVVTPDPTPTLTGIARDADGGNLRIDYEVYSGFSATPSTRVAYGSTTAAQDTDTSWTVTPALAAGDYEYRVRGWDGTVYGPWAVGWVQFTVDTTAPSAPDVSITGATTTTNTAVTGTVGKAVTANFTTTKNSGTVEIVYSVYNNVPTYSSRQAPACGSSSGGVVVLCRSGGSGYPVQTFAAVDTSTRLYAVAFDAAGNVSSSKMTPFYVNPDTAGVQKGHAWFFSDADAATNAGTGTGITPTPPVPDTATTSPTPLNATSGMTFGPDSPNTAMTHTDPVTAQEAPLVMTVSQFNGTAAESTPAKVLDTTKSFTVAAWVKPTSAATTSALPVVTQAGSQESSFFLQASSNTWRLCIPDSDASTWNGDCAYSSSTVAPNQWVFIVGEWDAINHQIRLYVNADGADSTGTPAVHYHASAPATVGGLYVGQDLIGSQVRHFVGSIFAPMAFQAVATPNQIYSLMTYETPSAT